MINTNVINGFGQIFLDSTKISKSKIKFEAKDPEEDKIIEGFEGHCEQCETEKLKKPCTICGE